MPKPEMEFFNPEDRFSWSPIEGVEGLEEMILARDEKTDDYTRLLRFAPGTDTSRLGTQNHDFWEEAFMISGSLHDLGLNQTFYAGMYACRPPGLEHGPWRTDSGAVVFETRYGREEPST
ncbi:MAG: cupin domain-containing protein [Actinomycetota bacterium]|nr:cupin domain-containing protein [Actinomycetota bacterium]